MIETETSLRAVLEVADGWQAYRALRLLGEEPGEVPPIAYQDPLGACLGPGGQPSPGATGEFLCHLHILGLIDSGAAAVATDWLEDARTPAMAWLDPPDEVPGELDTVGGARVWATASATCGLLVADRDPGGRAFDLLRGEADTQGRFTGGAYPTFAAAGAYWLQAGPKNEMSEWALKWCREEQEEWWGPWEWATALTFWAAAGVPAEHPTLDVFLNLLIESGSPEGWPNDAGLTLRALESMRFLGVG